MIDHLELINAGKLFMVALLPDTLPDTLLTLPDALLYTLPDSVLHTLLYTRPDALSDTLRYALPANSLYTSFHNLPDTWRDALCLYFS